MDFEKERGTNVENVKAVAYYASGDDPNHSQLVINTRSVRCVHLF